MKIPYNEELRPDTGLYNAKLGIWLFLASEVMLFGGLFSAYIMLRLSDPNWANYGQEALSVPLATLNTAILITSSVTMVMSWVSLKLNDLTKYKLYMGATLLCSVGFLIIKYIEYTTKFEHGLYPSTNNFLAVYFTLTGLHGLHVIGGIFVNYYLWKDFDRKSNSIASLLFSVIILYILLSPFNLFNLNATYLILIILSIAFFEDLLLKPKVTFKNQPECFTNRVEVAGLYWHFVDLVWIFLFPALYLL